MRDYILYLRVFNKFCKWHDNGKWDMIVKVVGEKKEVEKGRTGERAEQED